MKSNNWSLQTRFLHIGLVLTVSAQLFISLVMTAPDHEGSSFSKLAFETHEIVGLTALSIVLLHWGWSIFSQADGGLKHLFPVSKSARQEIGKEIRGLKQLKLPEAGRKGGLIGLIHGLGLLAVTGIAITGGFLFILFPETGEPGALAEFFAGLHETIAGLVWAYWIGHGGMAFIHHFAGHDIMKKMFNFRKEENEYDDLKENLVAQSASIHKQ